MGEDLPRRARAAVVGRERGRRFAHDLPAAIGQGRHRMPEKVASVIAHRCRGFYAILTLPNRHEVSMVLFNHATREMTAKIVYYGPGLCGKTTNLMVIFDRLDPSQKGKM